MPIGGWVSKHSAKFRGGLARGVLVVYNGGDGGSKMTK